MMIIGLIMAAPAVTTAGQPALRVGGIAARLMPGGPVPAAPGTVRIGAIPVRDLGLSNSYAINPWGYRYTYAVTESLAWNKANYNLSNGLIDVVDGNDATVLRSGMAVPAPGIAEYVVVDHGTDGAGAYTGDAGVLHVPCPAVGMEMDNCNGGSTFRAMLIGKQAGVNYFDDVAVYGINLIAPGSNATQWIVLW